ncbi:ATP-binding protein [Streptomyces harbinensis]|uniref:ATP-binding protein n=1 Tax=Streptomyces harbinensis TaxID=1176198 RepID=UPI00368D3A3D
MDPTPLIGREHPAGVLRSAVARARDSHGGLILVTGEAGIGKTTLVAGAAEEARRGGALVLGGSCWEAAGTPGYWPWTQVLRALRRAEPGTVLDGPLAALLGDPHTGTAPEADAFALHDAVTSALVAAAQHRPVLVVLDDLHWADGASLRLLEFAARHTWFERLLLIGVHRDTGPEGPPAVSAPATTLALTGLSRDETGALLARTTGEAPDAALIDATHRRTGGNPFFIEQTAALGEITPGVRDALHRRLALLSAPVTALLGHAAVLGREFGLPLLAAVSGTHPAEAAALLRQAVTARLLTPPAGDRYGFAHDLVREVLYEALPAAHARDRHAAAVRALGDGAPPAERARHARLAGDTLPPADRLDILQAAAADATNRLAHEEATGHLRHAHRLARAGDDARARVLTGLRYGESVRDWDVLRRTADEARELDDPGLLARVALSLYRVEGEEHRPFQAEMLLAATRALTRAGQVAAPGPAGSWAELERLARKVALQAAVRARRGATTRRSRSACWPATTRSGPPSTPPNARYSPGRSWPWPGAPATSTPSTSAWRCAGWPWWNWATPATPRSCGSSRRSAGGADCPGTGCRCTRTRPSGRRCAVTSRSPTGSGGGCGSWRRRRRRSASRSPTPI